MDLLDELFSLVKRIKFENGGSNNHDLWLKANRGPIEDFGNYEEYLDDGDVSSYEEFQELWLSYYPDPTCWYNLTTIEDGDYRGVFLRDKGVVDASPSMNCGHERDVSELLAWIITEVKRIVSDPDRYNSDLEQNLPPQHRTGTIIRRDLWDQMPEEREAFFQQIDQADVDEFVQRMSQQDHSRHAPAGRIKSMNANDFYRFCAMGYLANNYRGCDELSPKEQYYLHADGRDEGLKDLNLDDPDAFQDWLLNSRERGGHPWEICRGGNSTHVSLYVCHDSKGYYLSVAGSAVSRTIETVKLYLALCRNGLPVYMHDGDILADRLQEKEIVGIVPEDVVPCYCESKFPDQKIISFYHLPEENRDQIVKKCTWQPLPKVQVYISAKQ